MAEQIKSLQTGIKYKDTPIGQIPVDWEATSLGQILTFEYGESLPGALRKKGKTNVYGSNGIIGRHDKYLVYGPGLVIGRKGTVGAIAWSKDDFWPIDTTYYVSARQTKEDLRWLYYLLLSSRLEKLNASTGVPGLNRDIAYSEIIPLPPLVEQKKIAEILSTVDEAIEKTDQIIEKTKEGKNWLLEILFSYGINNSKYKANAEVGKMPEKWNVETLGNLISIKHGYAFKSQHFGSEGPILLTPGNFKENGGLYFNERNLKRYYGAYPEEFTFLKDDLVIVMTDLSSYCKILGNPALISLSETVLHNQRIGKVVLNDNKIDKKYLYYFFLSKRYKKTIISTATGTTVRHTAPDRIYRLKIALPSLEEQQEIVEILSSIDAKLDKEVTGKNKLEILKTGLMQVLLTGRIRVKA